MYCWNCKKEVLVKRANTDAVTVTWFGPTIWCRICGAVLLCVGG